MHYKTSSMYLYNDCVKAFDRIGHITSNFELSPNTLRWTASFRMNRGNYVQLAI